MVKIPDYTVWIAAGFVAVSAASYFAFRYISQRKKEKEVPEIETYDADAVKKTLKTLSKKADKKSKIDIIKKSKKEVKLVREADIEVTDKLSVKKKIVEQKAIKEVDMQEGKFYYEVKPFEYFNRSKLSIRYWRDRKKARKYPHKVVLVRFEMNNGRHREFIVKEESDGFVYNNEKYIFDIENKYYVIDSNIWAYDFHEGFSLPVKNNLVLTPELKKIFDRIEDESRKGIKRKINSDLLKETIEASGITQIESAVNPKILERVSESQFVQMILQGATLGKLFKVLLILVIIILIVAAADMVIDFISSGLIDEIGLGKK